MMGNGRKAESFLYAKLPFFLGNLEKKDEKRVESLISEVNTKKRIVRETFRLIGGYV